MNKKTLIIIAIVQMLAGLACTGLGIFWQMSVYEQQQRRDKHHEAAGDLLQKTKVAQDSQDPKAQEMLKELEKENRYVKYAEDNIEREEGDRNLYLGIGLTLLVAGGYFFMKAKKKN